MSDIRLPGVSDEINATINRLNAIIMRRRPRNDLRDAFYDGRRLLRYGGGVVPPQYYRLGLVLGWVGKGVDLLARRCNLDGFEWADGNLDALGWRDLWDQNMLGSEVDQAITSSLIHGVAFAVTTRGGDGEPPALIHFKDATCASGDWDSRSRRLTSLLSITGRDDDGQVRSLALYLDGETITAKKDRGKWDVHQEEHPWGVPVEPLPYRPRLRRPLGSSRITRSAMGLQDAATRELIRLEGHMDVYSYPEMWMLGSDASVFKNQDGTTKADYEVLLGRMKAIPDDDDQDEPSLARVDVKQFPAASPQPHLAALNAYAKLFAREQSLPDSSLAITDFANPTSAESYDASQYELIAEAEGAVDDWGPALRRSFVRALAIANGESSPPDEWASIMPAWRNPRYLSKSGQADAGMKIISAKPDLADTDVGLELLGLTPDQIRRYKGERRRMQASSRLDALIAAGQQAQEEAPPDGVAG